MNEHFKQLAEQAGYGTRWNTTEQFEQFMEKFANEIYKDIITVVAAQALSNQSALDVFKNLKRIYEGGGRMKVLNWGEINSLAVKQIGKRAVYVVNGLEYGSPKDDEIWKFVMTEIKSICGGDTNEFYSVMSSLVNGGLFFFDSEEEQYRFFKIFEHPLTDSSAIYACTYNSDGECESENT